MRFKERTSLTSIAVVLPLVPFLWLLSHPSPSIHPLSPILRVCWDGSAVTSGLLGNLLINPLHAVRAKGRMRGIEGGRRETATRKKAGMNNEKCQSSRCPIRARRHPGFVCFGYRQMKAVCAKGSGRWNRRRMA